MGINKAKYRVGLIELDILPFLKNSRGKNQYIELCGVQVKMTSQRYEVFKRSIVCCECGITGEYFAIEKTMPDHVTMNYHLNLYAIDDDGEEVLMTKDHILPKSKGGEDILSNYQTMCQPCNTEKGNKIE